MSITLLDRFLLMNGRYSRWFEGCPKFVVDIEIFQLACDLVRAGKITESQIDELYRFPFEKFWIEVKYTPEFSWGALIEGTLYDYKALLVQSNYIVQGPTVFSVAVSDEGNMTFTPISHKSLLEDPLREFFSQTKKRKKQGFKLPLISYSRVKIRQSPIIKYIGSSDPSGIETRAHLVRGHFKRRKSGMYWWSPFVRGNQKLGIKNKDYEFYKEDCQQHLLEEKSA